MEDEKTLPGGTQDKGEATGAATGQPAGQELDLGQFKNPKDLLKSYKEIQGAFTRLSQQNKEMTEQLKTMQEQAELARYSAPTTPQGPVVQKDFVSSWSENPEAAVGGVVAKQYATMRIAEVLEEEHLAKPEDFQERYGYVQWLTQNPQYSGLARSAGGVKKLFQLADKTREIKRKQEADKAIAALFGEQVTEEEIETLRSLVKGGKGPKPGDKTKPSGIGSAYMPDVTSSTRTGAQTGSGLPDYETVKREAVKKGDADTVLSALFEEVLRK